MMMNSIKDFLKKKFYSMDLGLLECDFDYIVKIGYDDNGYHIVAWNPTMHCHFSVFDGKHFKTENKAKLYYLNNIREFCKEIKYSGKL
jgi:hypothetical protein